MQKDGSFCIIKTMKDSSSFLTTPVAILLSSFVISIAILMHGGIIQIGSIKTVGAKPTQQAQPAAAGQPAAPAAPTKVNVDIGHFPIKGDKNAKVTVIEFADFQCPFCEKFFSQTESNLIKDYVNTGKIKFAFRNWAFLGPESTFAAEGAECANEQGKFWEYHDYLYSHQGQENSGAFAKDKLEGFAGSIGLDADKFKTCLETDKYATQVKDEYSAGQTAGVNGTPATFVNGILISGAVPYASFQQTIDAALK